MHVSIPFRLIEDINIVQCAWMNQSQLTDIHILHTDTAMHEFNVGYFPNGFFPSGYFARVLFQVATSQMCNFPFCSSRNVRLLAHPSRSAFGPSILLSVCIVSNHRLIKITELDTRCRLFKIQMKLVHNNPEAKAQRGFAQSRKTDSLCLVKIRRQRETPQGCCERVSSKS